MLGKKKKSILIVLIFLLVFNFSYPVVYASGAEKNTSGTSSNSTLGTIVDHGLRFTY